MDLTQTVIVCCDWGKYQLSSLECTFIVPKYYITLPTKVCLVKAMVFPVVTYGCESWTVKKAECQRIDAFELCCVGEDSNQSILKEISPGYSLEGLMLKLKLQNFGHLL